MLLMACSGLNSCNCVRGVNPSPSPSTESRDTSERPRAKALGCLGGDGRKSGARTGPMERLSRAGPRFKTEPRASISIRLHMAGPGDASLRSCGLGKRQEGVSSHDERVGPADTHIAQACLYERSMQNQRPCSSSLELRGQVRDPRAADRAIA